MEKSPIRFGTDGWRAIIAEQFTLDNISRVVGAIGNYILNHFLTEKPVVVGYDTRFLADRFAAHAAEILKAQGLSVLLTDGYAPTPIVAYAAKGYDTAGAIMFTASHNPPEYCGIKFIPHYAGPATTEITNELLALIAEGDRRDAPYVPAATPGGIDLFKPYERLNSGPSRCCTTACMAPARGISIASGRRKSTRPGSR
jgi:phosphomannomutase